MHGVSDVRKHVQFEFVLLADVIVSVGLSPSAGLDERPGLGEVCRRSIFPCQPYCDLVRWQGAAELDVGASDLLSIGEVEDLRMFQVRPADKESAEMRRQVGLGYRG